MRFDRLTSLLTRLTCRFYGHWWRVPRGFDIFEAPIRCSLCGITAAEYQKEFDAKKRREWEKRNK